MLLAASRGLPLARPPPRLPPDPTTPVNLSDIKELLRIIAESGAEEVEVEQDGLKLVVRRHATTFSVQQAPAFPPMMQMPQMPPPGYGYAPPPPAAAPLPPAAPAPSAPAFTAASTPAPAISGETVRAPIVGTFYRTPSPDAPVFVEVGDRIAKGQVLCIIEAMKLMNEVESEVAGTLRQVLVENAQPVEYDQPLFIVEPD